MQAQEIIYEDSALKCSKFDSCSIALCPFDPDIDKRIWYVGEPVCYASAAKDLDWVKAQRKLNKRAAAKYTSIGTRMSKFYDQKPLTLKDVKERVRTKVMTEEQREAARDRLMAYRMSKSAP